mgnify:FL=1
MVARDTATAGDLAYLRRDSLRMVLISMGVVLYLWCNVLLQLSNMYTGPSIGSVIWGPLFLGVGLAAAWVARERHLALASALAIGGVGVAVLSSMWVSRAQVLPYMLAVVVSLAGLLFDIRAVVAVTLLCDVSVVAICWLRWRCSPLSAEVLSPVLLVGVVGLLSFLMVRNLYLALHWALDRAMAAQRNADEARTHRGELARTLKALNEAYQRLEYISYDLARAREVAEEARANKQRFVATVSHEMRTPLNVLAALSELMYFSPERYSGAKLAPEFRRDAREIYRSSRHLVRLIDDVLDMTRIEAGQMRIEFQPVRLGDIVAEALDMIRPLVRGRAIALEAEVPPDLPPVWVDRARVQQVLLNLLNNAQGFTERGSITVHAAREAEHVRVTVADTGVGIPPEAHEEMFKEFYQVEGLAARGQGGHGLGLAVCKRFVEMHGGRIWVESDGVPGHGTRFSFALPLAPVQTQTTGLLESPKPMRTASGRGRVLVVLGADPAAVRLLEQGLQEYQIVQAGTAKEIADLVNKAHVQAILINSARGSCPGRHLRELRLEVGDAIVPIVLCPLVGLRELGRMLGVVDYLVKPVLPEALWALMDRLGGGVRRVLVVDDDPQMARVVSRVLQMSGREYEVLCAYDGEEALGKMRWRRPDVVLLDLVMPVKDGFAVLAEMQRDAVLRRIPVAVITAQEPTPEDERRMGGRSLVVHAPGGFSNKEAISYLRAVLSARQAAVG